jgi:hypothetical protein
MTTNSPTSGPDGPGHPHLPRMVAIDDGPAPAAPTDVRDTGLDPAILSDLALKAAYTVSQFSTEWVARRLHLPQGLVGDLLEGLRAEHLLDILGEAGPFGFRYAISGRGRERAARLMEISGYVGPAPVSLEAYAAMVERQADLSPAISPEEVREAVSGLVLPERSVELAGLAASSGRSLFLHGPPGNGKTSLGRALHDTLAGQIWVPHCIGVEGGIIRVFDPQCHQPTDGPGGASRAVDARWVRIRRPLIVGGGEMTLDAFDLTYSPSLRYYEAPLHVKSNGGTFLVDDFGRQRVDPHELLNRWIIPLEHRVDYLTLQTGQKIQVPFRQMLIIATNLDPGQVTDPAFLRRMGYRLMLGPPTAGLYARIFDGYAVRKGAAVEPGLVGRLLERYRLEGRELRCCEPRDLIERVEDICRFRGRPLEVRDELMELAWAGYFGTSPSGAQIPQT